MTNWSENICIGTVFNSNTTINLYNQYKSYAEKQQCFSRVIKGPFFVQFYRDAEMAMSGYPGSLLDNLESPKIRPFQYLEFLNQLYQLTPLGHSDHLELHTACQNMVHISNDVDRMVKHMKNFDKLLGKL